MDGTPVWKIIKKYDQHEFMATSKSLGMVIDVYFESIGTTTPEYLVNMEYLKIKCMEYQLKLVDNKGFGVLHDTIIKSGNFKPKNTMNEGLSQYSFFNDYFIFEKN